MLQVQLQQQKSQLELALWDSWLVLRAADPAGGRVSPLWGLGLPEVFCLLSACELLSPSSPELHVLERIHAGGCIGVTPVAG